MTRHVPLRRLGQHLLICWAHIHQMASVHHILPESSRDLLLVDFDLAQELDIGDQSEAVAGGEFRASVRKLVEQFVEN